MKKIILAVMATTLLASSCKKTYITNVTVKADTPTVRTLTAHFNNTISFDHSQNINFVQDGTNDSGQINLWMDSKNGVPGTVVNIYCFIGQGTKVNLLATTYGQVFQVKQNVNPAALEWYYQVTFMGNFNGENIFNATINTYPGL